MIMEVERTDAKDVQKAIDELWKLEGKTPPPRNSANAAGASDAGVGVGSATRAKRAERSRRQRARRRGEWTCKRPCDTGWPGPMHSLVNLTHPRGTLV